MQKDHFEAKKKLLNVSVDKLKADIEAKKDEEIVVLAQTNVLKNKKKLSGIVKKATKKNKNASFLCSVRRKRRVTYLLLPLCRKHIKRKVSVPSNGSMIFAKTVVVPSRPEVERPVHRVPVRTSRNSMTVLLQLRSTVREDRLIVVRCCSNTLLVFFLLCLVVFYLRSARTHKMRGSTDHR